MRRKRIDTGSYTEFDVQTENFNGYFEMLIKEMSEEQKNKIPDKLKNKLISLNNGAIRPNKLNYLEKIYILEKALGKTVYTVIEDTEDKNAMSIDHYRMYAEQARKNQSLSSEANVMINGGAFVIGGRDLVRWLFHLNDVCVSGAYNHALKIRNIKPQNIFKERKSLYYFVNLLIHYEGNKRRIIRDYGISMAEFFCLLYFYDSDNKSASPLYEDILANAVKVNKYTILKALKSIHDKKYIEKYGTKQQPTYCITSYGINIVNDILVKYITPV